MEITEKEWDSGESIGDREIVIKGVLEKIKGKGGIDGDEVRKRSGIKWYWASLKNLVDAGDVERIKKGQKYYHRIVRTE